MNVKSNQEVEGLSRAKCITKLPVFENTELVIYPATALDKEVIVNYEMVAIIPKLIYYRAPVSSYIGVMKTNLSPPQVSGWKSRTYQDISMDGWMDYISATSLTSGLHYVTHCLALFSRCCM